MSKISGTFYWTGDLPNEDDVEDAPGTVFSGDFGEQWQCMATEPVIRCLCDALRFDETVRDLHDPTPEDHGWYTSLTVDGWHWLLHVQWIPDGDNENCFQFGARLHNNWWHQIIHRSSIDSRLRAVGAAFANAFAKANEIDGVAFNQCETQHEGKQ